MMHMSQLSVFLDLDRTLYRTTAAGMAKWQKIGELYPQVNAITEHDRQHEFYRRSGDTYAYDFTAHVEALGLMPEVVYDQLRQSELADGRMEHDGVYDLVSWLQSVADVKILTYGIDDYQRLKASLCPSLQDVEVITTLGGKDEYLQDKGCVWLVDDKPLGDKLPATVQFIQACVEDQTVKAEPWPVVVSLQQVHELLEQALSEVPRCG